MPAVTAICPHRIDKSLWHEERGDWRWLGLTAIWTPSAGGKQIRTTCRQCRAFIGFRPVKPEHAGA